MIFFISKAKEIFTSEIENIRLKTSSPTGETCKTGVTTKRKSLYEAYCDKLATKSLNIENTEDEKTNCQPAIKKIKLNE